MENGVEGIPKPDPNTEVLGRLVRQYEDAADSSITHRKEGELSRDYRDGKQWTSAEIDTLNKRKQPVITDNVIADKIDYLLGLERKTRTDPKAYPRNPQDADSADLATDAIRYVFDANDFPQVKSLAFDHMMVEGVGVAEICRYDGKDKITKVRWDRFYWDPHSMELDFSDAMFMGVITWFDQTRLLAKYPKKKDMVEGTMSEAIRTSVDTHDDKPTVVRFYDTKRRRIQVFEHYYWETGKWMRAVFMKGGFLEEPSASPYLDEDNKPEHPYVAQAAYRDREGNPYGVVRRYMPLQDEINKRRSKMLHALSTRRVIADRGAVASVEKARKEVQRPDGYIEAVPGMRFEVENNADIGMAQFQMLQHTQAAMSATGPNEALLGLSGNISGKAKQLDQEGGAVQIGPLFDEVRHFQKRCARKVWHRIKQFWTEETWIRVTDDEQGMKFIGFNVPRTMGEQAAEKVKSMGLPPEQAQAMVMQIAQNPMSKVPTQPKNQPAQMDVDIIIEESPDVITLQQEQFAQLSDLAQSGMIQLPPEVLIEASNLRNKKKLLEMIKGGGEKSPAQQEQEAAAQALQKQAAENEVRKVGAEADKNSAFAEKAQAEAAAIIHDAARPEPMPKGPAGPALNG